MSDMQYINGRWVEKKEDFMGELIGFVGTIIAIYLLIEFLRWLTLGIISIIEWIGSKMDPNTRFVAKAISIVLIVLLIGKIGGQL
jgi:hypothetical protein